MSERYDIYLSACVAEEDKPFCEGLVRWLEGHGVDGRPLEVFTEDKILPGDYILQAREKGLVTSPRLLMVITPESLTENLVELERSVKQASGVSLIPLILHEAPLPSFMEAIKAVRISEDAADTSWSARLLSVLKAAPLQGSSPLTVPSAATASIPGSLWMKLVDLYAKAFGPEQRYMMLQLRHMKLRCPGDNSQLEQLEPSRMANWYLVHLAQGAARGQKVLDELGHWKGTFSDGRYGDYDAILKELDRFLHPPPPPPKPTPDEKATGPRQPPRPSMLEVWRCHLESTRNAHTHLKLYGIRRQGKAVQIELKQVYVELSAERLDGSMPKVEERFLESGLTGRGPSHGLDLHEALGRSRRVIFKGDPGSGKTTLLRYVARVVSDAWLRPDAEAAARALLGLSDDHSLPVPVFTTLDMLDKYLDRLDIAPKLLTAQPFLGFLQDLLWSGCLNIPREELERTLEEGRLLLLLDGLDEIPSHKDRKRAVLALARFLERFGKLPVVLTSRTRAFKEDLRGELPGLDLYGLQPMSREQMKRFLETWHRALHPTDLAKANKEAEALLGEIMSHPKVLEMVDNPSILTLVAILRQVEFRLPERRVDLYAGVIDLFLQKDADSEVVKAWPELLQSLDPTEKRRLLARLALSMHEEGEHQGRTASVVVPVVQFALLLEQSGRSRGEEQARKDALEVLDWFEQRSGLLVRRDEGVQFAHLGFQEYLVADALSSLEGETLWKALQPHLLDDWWNEPIRLLLAKLEARAEGLLARLTTLGTKKNGPVDWKQRGRGVALAMGGLEDIRAMHLSKEVRDKVLESLEELLGERSQASVADRVEAALALGQVGDPRLGLEKEERWVWIPPGTFQMGGTAYDDEKPIHTVNISRGFWLGKYPVTNQEYGAFVKAGGYEAQEWWDEKGWRSVQAEHIREPRHWRDPTWNGPNQPVVGVSWFEAAAFCRWLSAAWRKGRPAWLLDPVEARLPSEAEWEYAARGPEGREYPWGAEAPTPKLANYGDSNIGRTTPVGLYPEGTSWVGALDMAGNVWEWCADPWRGNYQGAPTEGSPWIGNKQSDSRVARGGSWDDVAFRLRGAYRFRWRPRIGNGDRGFRVVVAVSGGSSGTLALER